VPSSADGSARLAHFEQIPAETVSHAATTDVHDARAQLNSVASERIRRLTAELQGLSPAADQADIAAIRLLLSEYSTAVGHLRAVARLAASTVDAAAEPLREARRTVHRLSKTLAAAPADPPDPR
jgi:hypothetical protein